jgi:hypothetical protein
MWVAGGVFCFVKLTAGWRLVPAIVFIGIGGLFFRGAMMSTVRRERGPRS